MMEKDREHCLMRCFLIEEENYMNENYEICTHVKETWQLAVLVRPGCKMAHLIRGTLAVTRRECRNCGFCEPKEKGCN
jgi:hypothetical protein